MPRLSEETLRERARERSEKPAVRSRPGAAHKLNVHPRTIDRLVKRGKLRGVKIGSRMMIDDDSIDALIAAGGCAVTRSRGRKRPTRSRGRHEADRRRKGRPEPSEAIATCQRLLHETAPRFDALKASIAALNREVEAAEAPLGGLIEVEALAHRRGFRVLRGSQL